ncbi:MAG: uptake transporter, substrate-binding protein, partial [Nitrososphaera sp.]|nr:uptake transporter, substrate-binding protein [Nitrososphaera sp.]
MKNTIKFSIAIAITIAVIASSGAISFPSLSPDTGLGDGNDSGSMNIQTGEQKSLRVGYFPNINHAQAVIGLGNGDFQRALGDNVQVTTQ